MFAYFQQIERATCWFRAPFCHRASLPRMPTIAPIVNEPCTHHLSTRRNQSIFNRCRIGHSRLTHKFLLKGGSPECIPCNCPLTIKHLFDFNNVRQRFYQVPSVQDLFKTVKPEGILEFLKQLRCTDFYEFFECLTCMRFFSPLTCLRREDGLSCRHSVEPPLTHSLTHSFTHSLTHPPTHHSHTYSRTHSLKSMAGGIG